MKRNDNGKKPIKRAAKNVPSLLTRGKAVKESARSVYRTIFVCLKDRGGFKLVYGHTIEWRMGPLDYEVKIWRKHNVDADMFVFFCDLTSIDVLSAFIDKGETEITCSDGTKSTVSFRHDTNEKSTLGINSLSQEYNPFMSYFTEVERWFSTGRDFLGVPISEFHLLHKKELELVERSYGISLNEHPHLIGTFASFLPTRLRADISRHEASGKSWIEFRCVDEFDEYGNASVEIYVKNKNGDNNITVKPRLASDYNFLIPFDPDFCRVEIRYGNKPIYRSEGYFIRGIALTLNVQESKLSIAGETVDRTSQHEIMIKAKTHE
jgi:hypothetical protein